MKAIVRIEVPTTGTAGDVLDLVPDSVTAAKKYEELYGGVEADYEVITVPVAEEASASASDQARSSYNHTNTTFTWIPMTQRQDYVDITTTDTAVADGHYEILADGTASIVVDIQKKSGVDDSNMVAAGDNDKLLINAEHGVQIVEGLTPSLVNGAKSITIKSSLQITSCPISAKFYDNSMEESNALLLRFT